ncbi:MAG: hypothetical protein ACRD8U_25650 [Pyrinomonadaceae bacterium]
MPPLLKVRLIELAAPPNTFDPITSFSEADEPSRLFQFYLLDTLNFQPNVFTATIPGINDGAIPTAANAANGGLPTIGAVRVVLEPKPGLPTDPNDPRAFIDIFMDFSGLFVINTSGEHGRLQRAAAIGRSCLLGVQSLNELDFPALRVARSPAAFPERFPPDSNTTTTSPICIPSSPGLVRQAWSTTN